MTVMGEWQKKKMLSKSQAVPVAPITTGHRFFGCPRSQAGLERTSLKLVSDHTFLDLRWHETAPQHSAVLPWPFFFFLFLPAGLSTGVFPLMTAALRKILLPASHSQDPTLP